MIIIIWIITLIIVYIIGYNKGTDDEYNRFIGH